MGFWGLPIRLDIARTNPLDTDKSTADTIQRMKQIARASASDPLITSVVNFCITSLPKPVSNREIVRSLFWWIKNKVMFVQDEQILGTVLGYEDVAQELLIAPSVLLNMPKPMGDCDDFAMLTASCLMAAQVPCSFVTIAVDAEEPNRFSHVYVSAFLRDENRWVSFDAPFGDMLGWEYNGQVFRKVTWLI